MATVKGGEKLNAKLKEMSDKVSKGTSLKVGFMAGATYPKGGIPVAAVAAILEFGAPRASIPPRPFFRNMIAAKSPSWPTAIRAQLEDSDFDAARAMDRVGQGIVEQLQTSIRETNAPPLSQVTLMLRKMRRDDPNLVVTGATVGEAARRVAAGESVGDVSQKPLVDTGRLLDSPTFKVE